MILKQLRSQTITGSIIAFDQKSIYYCGGYFLNDTCDDKKN
jgi:hypothetical protein